MKHLFRMKLSLMFLIILCHWFFYPFPVWSQETGSLQPKIGKGAAARYFLERNKAAALSNVSDGAQDREPSSDENGDETEEVEIPIPRKERKRSGYANQSHSNQLSSKARYLGLHLGTYLDEDHYQWGTKDTGRIGRLTAGVTYRLGEWVKSMDLNFRADVNTYQFKEGRAVKLSLLPMITFPDVNSGFPLYFGGGAGVGVFFKQIPKESSLSFDYQLVAGIRFLNLWNDSMGITLESGIKNHVGLLDDGQYNGVFLALGLAFTF